MASVNAVIRVDIDASAANAGLASMAAQMGRFNKGMIAGSAAMSAAQVAAARKAAGALNATGNWMASTGTMMTATGRMAQQFDKGTAKSFSSFRQNMAMNNRSMTASSGINQLAAARVRALQTQYVALGREVDGVQKVMKAQPTGMVANRAWGSSAEFAAQRAILFRRNLTMGANSMINWGKNTQWAGRQMMVGMGIPMGLAAVGAVRSFKEIEAASISFKRVYGDATTSAGEKAQMLGTIQSGVAQEMTKYGIAVSDTLDVAAKAAATGQKGDALIAATRETMRVATLGNMDYMTALEGTIATQTAFGVSARGMTRVTDFMNAAENQTILSMEDMSKAIPRVAPVIRGLGGDVEDLGVLMTALRAGGVTAEQGANALKSGLASLINPTSTATDAMKEFGIPLDKIVQANKGDLIGTVEGFGKALGKLPKFQQQQALESLFGKYQYARMGALFRNINKKQAQETAKLSKESNANLAQMSENELGQIADSNLTQFQGALERLKAAAAPLGGQIMGFLAPIIDFGAKIVDFFATNDIAGQVLMWGSAFAGLAGIGTMLTGVFANFFGTMIKGGQFMHRMGRGMIGRPLPKYETIADLEATAAQRQLGAAAEATTASLYGERGAVTQLAAALNAMNAELRQAAGLQAAAAGGVVTGGAVAATSTASKAAATTASTTTAATTAVPVKAAVPAVRQRAQSYVGLPKGKSDPVLAHIGARVPISQSDLERLAGQTRTDTTTGKTVPTSAALFAQQQLALDPDQRQRGYSGQGLYLADAFNNQLADPTVSKGAGWQTKANWLSALDQQGTFAIDNQLRMMGVDPSDDPKQTQRIFDNLVRSVAAGPSEISEVEHLPGYMDKAIASEFGDDPKMMAAYEKTKELNAVPTGEDGKQRRGVAGAVPGALPFYGDKKVGGQRVVSARKKGFYVPPAVDARTQALLDRAIRDLDTAVTDRTGAEKESTVATKSSTAAQQKLQAAQKATQNETKLSEKATAARTKRTQELDAARAAQVTAAQNVEKTQREVKSAQRYLGQSKSPQAIRNNMERLRVASLASWQALADQTAASQRVSQVAARNARLDEDLNKRRAAVESQRAERVANGTRLAQSEAKAETTMRTAATQRAARVNSELARQESLTSATKGFSGKEFANKLMGGPAPTQRGGMWATMRQGGAFTGETANAWSNKLMGMGMAADMVTMGLMAAGKDVPAWSHMVGMGMMTMGMFPGMVAKPAGMLGAAMKKAAAPVGRFTKEVGTTALMAGAYGAELLLAKKAKPGQMLTGVGKATSVMGKIGMVGVAAAAVVGTLFVFKDAYDNSVNNAKQVGAAMATSQSAMTAFAQETGQESRTMKEHRIALSNATGQTITQAEMTETNNKLAGQAGQVMIETINTAKQGGTQAGISSVVAQAAGLYGEGLASKAESVKIAGALAEQTGLGSQTVEIVAMVKEVIMGKNPDPIEIQAKLTSLTLTPGALGQLGSQLAADSSWLAQGFGGGEDALARTLTAEAAAQRMMAEGAVPDLTEYFNAIETGFNMASDEGQLAMRQQSLDTFEAIEGTFDEIATPLIADGSIIQGQMEEFRAARLDAYNQMARNYYSEDPTSDYQVGLKTRSGLGAIEMAYVRGEVDQEVLGRLFSGGKESIAKVGLAFSSVGGADQSRMFDVLAEEDATEIQTRVSKDLENVMKMGDPQRLQNLAPKLEAYTALPEGRKQLQFSIESTGVQEIKNLEGVAKSIDGLPPSIKKTVSVNVDGATKTDLENIKSDFKALQDFKPTQIEKAMGPGGAFSGTQITRGNVRQLITELETYDNALTKAAAHRREEEAAADQAAGKASRSTSSSENNPANPEPTDAKAAKTIEVKTKYKQPTNKIQDPKGTVEIKTKYAKPSNSIYGGKGGAGSALGASMGSGAGAAVTIKTKWGKPSGKIPKPEPVTVPVVYQTKGAGLGAATGALAAKAVSVKVNFEPGPPPQAPAQAAGKSIVEGLMPMVAAPSMATGITSVTGMIPSVQAPAVASGSTTVNAYANIIGLAQAGGWIPTYDISKAEAKALGYDVGDKDDGGNTDPTVSGQNSPGTGLGGASGSDAPTPSTSTDRRDGGAIKFANGGKAGSTRFKSTTSRVSGSGGPKSDKVPMMLSPGEFVMNARSVRKYGPRLMSLLNRRRINKGMSINFADGGEPAFRGVFSGQKVTGPGGPRDDKIPAWLSNGEFVMNAKSVKKYGLGFMSKINSMKLSGGGKAVRLKDGSDDWSWKKDVERPLAKAAAAFTQAAKMMNSKKVPGGVTGKNAVLQQIGDDPKALKHFLGMKKDKQLAFIKKAEKAVIRQEALNYKAEMDVRNKASAARLRLASKILGGGKKVIGGRPGSININRRVGAEAALALDDSEIAEYNAITGKNKKKKKKSYLRKALKAHRKEQTLQDRQSLLEQGLEDSRQKMIDDARESAVNRNRDPDGKGTPNPYGADWMDAMTDDEKAIWARGQAGQGGGHETTKLAAKAQAAAQARFNQQTIADSQAQRTEMDKSNMLSQSKRWAMAAGGNTGNAFGLTDSAMKNLSQEDFDKMKQLEGMGTPEAKAELDAFAAALNAAATEALALAAAESIQAKQSETKFSNVQADIAAGRGSGIADLDQNAAENLSAEDYQMIQDLQEAGLPIGPFVESLNNAADAADALAVAQRKSALLDEAAFSRGKAAAITGGYGNLNQSAIANLSQEDYEMMQSLSGAELQSFIDSLNEAANAALELARVERIQSLAKEAAFSNAKAAIAGGNNLGLSAGAAAALTQEDYEMMQGLSGQALTDFQNALNAAAAAALALAAAERTASLKRDAAFQKAQRAFVQSGGAQFGLTPGAMENLSQEDYEMLGQLSGQALQDFVNALNDASQAATDLAEAQRIKSLNDEVAFNDRFNNAVTSGLSQDALSGLSQEDFEMMQNMDATELIAFKQALNDAAESAKVAALKAMTVGQRYQELSGLLDTVSQSYKDQWAAIGEQRVVEQTGKTRAQIEAENQLNQVIAGQYGQEQTLAQRAIAEINKQYDEQVKLLDKVIQSEQIITNLRKARLSVASSLSTGDISGAAAAAEDARAQGAQANLDLMKTALQEEKEAKIEAKQEYIDMLQDKIDLINDEIFRTTNLIEWHMATTALAAANVTAAIDIQNISLKASNAYWDAIRADTEVSLNRLASIMGMDFQPLLDGTAAANLAWQSYKNETISTSNTMVGIAGKLSDLAGKDLSPIVNQLSAVNSSLWAVDGSLTTVGTNLGNINGADFSNLTNTMVVINYGWLIISNTLSTVLQQLRDIAAEERDAAGRRGGVGSAHGRMRFSAGGFVPGVGNSDSVHAMLTPGEFVVKKAQAQKLGPLLADMNQPNFKFSDLPGMVSASSSPSRGEVEGNTYNVVVNATTGANAEEIATIAVRKIKDLNNGRLKGRNQ